MRPLANRVQLLSGEGALSVFTRARRLEAEGRDIVHLELGEPDFHPDGTVVDAAKSALEAGRDRYTPPLGLPELREAIASYLRLTRSLSVSADNVVTAPGCKMILSLVATSLIEPGDQVLYPDPGFPIYPSLIRALGGVPVAYGLHEANGFQPDPEEIEAAITPSTKLLITNFPNNPTGTVPTDEIQERLAAVILANDLWLIADEIYARIIYDRSYTSLATLPGMQERTAVVDGFSKTFAMTGWRLGYAVVPQALIGPLYMLISNTYTCASEFIQLAGVAALADCNEAAAKMVREFAKRRDQFIVGLNEIAGFRCLPPAGAFYAWVNVEQTGRSAEDIAELLLEQAGVAGNAGGTFGKNGRNFLRFSFAASAERLTEAVNRIHQVSSVWQREATPQAANR